MSFFHIPRIYVHCAVTVKSGITQIEIVQPDTHGDNEVLLDPSATGWHATKIL